MGYFNSRSSQFPVWFTDWRRKQEPWSSKLCLARVGGDPGEQAAFHLNNACVGTGWRSGWHYLEWISIYNHNSALWKTSFWRVRDIKCTHSSAAFRALKGKSSLWPGTHHSTATVPCPELVVMGNASSGLSTRWFTLQLDYLQIQMQLRICELNVVPFQGDLISVNSVRSL